MNQPVHGDANILGNFIYRDLKSLGQSSQLPTGVINLLSGSKNFFIVVLVDFGYVYESKRNYKNSHEIGKYSAFQLEPTFWPFMK